MKTKDRRLYTSVSAGYSSRRIVLFRRPTRISIGEPYGAKAGAEGSVSFRRSWIREGILLVRYLSDVNLRAVLAVLINRAGGTVEIVNAELYDAMLPDQGRTERFLVEETSTGLRLSLVPQDGENTRSR